jgi:DNA-binding LacI/PurR family transcriptional regulator
VSALVGEHPDLKTLLCANDSMAIGALAALKPAGKADSILVVGFDNISACLPCAPSRNRAGSAASSDRSSPSRRRP